MAGLSGKHGIIGREFGNYIVESLLRTGAMGAVFRGKHRYLDDEVAIKVLHGSFSEHPTIAQRFFVEAKAARDIGHPGIVRILDFGQNDDGVLYLVMELLKGESLQDVVARGPMSERRAAAIGLEIAAALAAAHKKGIIHRDLKPDNIFLTHEDEVKVLDFGVAKVAESGVERTSKGALLGTARYMSPEQARGAKSVGPAADIYSLGVVLYQMLAGRTPFDGDAMQVIAQLALSPPTPPSVYAGMSREMEGLILQCLEKDPGARPPGMEEIRDRLKALLPTAPAEPLPSAVEPSGPSTVREMPAPPPLPEVAPTLSEGSPVPSFVGQTEAVSSVARAGSRGRWWLLPLGVLALVALVGGVGLALHRLRPASSAPTAVVIDPVVVAQPGAPVAPPADPAPPVAEAPTAAPPAAPPEEPAPPVAEAPAPAPPVAEAPAKPARKTASAPSRRAAAPTPADENTGFLIASTQPRAKVIIDEEDTGRWTPIAARNKLPLRKGSHVVTFLSNGESWNFVVEIKPGEDTKITQKLIKQPAK